MWLYFLGPFLSILPKRWRRSLPFATSWQWKPATVISGFVQFAGAIVAQMYWYSLTSWIDRGLDAALAGKLGNHVTDHDIGITALILWGTHPLTWALAYCGVEGAVRLCGAVFSDNNLGTLPLFLIDKVFAAIFRRGGKEAGDAPPGSFAGVIRDRMLVATLPSTSDELRFKRDGADEVLEIHASRKKDDWTPPRVVRYQDGYYRLEEFSRGRPPRPFCYVLRKLPAGVPGAERIGLFTRLDVPRPDQSQSFSFLDIQNAELFRLGTGKSHLSLNAQQFVGMAKVLPNLI